MWCRGRESNSHFRRNRILNPARLPIPPPRQFLIIVSYLYFVTIYKRAGAVALERPVLRDTRASCTSSTNSANTCLSAGAQVYVNLALVKTSLLLSAN